ncbi:MAG: hypothetical protein H0U70_02545 [Tatlockia sp.]|nr:hypothetical protein [Tatlockia sp.]
MKKSKGAPNTFMPLVIPLAIKSFSNNRFCPLITFSNFYKIDESTCRYITPGSPRRTCPLEGNANQLAQLFLLAFSD